MCAWAIATPAAAGPKITEMRAEKVVGVVPTSEIAAAGVAAAGALVVSSNEFDSDIKVVCNGRKRGVFKGFSKCRSSPLYRKFT